MNFLTYAAYHAALYFHHRNTQTGTENMLNANEQIRRERMEAMQAERSVNLTSAQQFADMARAEMKAGNMMKCNEYAIAAERHDERAQWLASQIRAMRELLGS